MRHDLKTWLPYFDAIIDGSKPFEVRKNDRDYKVGDTLRLIPFDPEKGRAVRRFGMRHCDKDVTYVLAGGQFGIDPGYVVLGLAPFDYD